MNDVIEQGRHLAKMLHREDWVEHLALSLMLFAYTTILHPELVHGKVEGRIPSPSTPSKPGPSSKRRPLHVRVEVTSRPGASRNATLGRKFTLVQHRRPRGKWALGPGARRGRGNVSHNLPFGPQPRKWQAGRESPFLHICYSEKKRGHREHTPHAVPTAWSGSRSADTFPR